MSRLNQHNSLEKAGYIKNKISSLVEKIWNKAAYILDLTFNTLSHHNGFTKPKVYKGYFSENSDASIVQERLFNELLKNWFYRERFQIVFRWQTAGIVKNIKGEQGDFDEAHIRFFEDGAIDIELEQWRFNWWHWRWERISGHEFLINLLQDLNISQEDKNCITQKLLQDKQMHELCEVNMDNDEYIWFLATYWFLLILSIRQYWMYWVLTNLIKNLKNTNGLH